MSLAAYSRKLAYNREYMRTHKRQRVRVLTPEQRQRKRERDSKRDFTAKNHVRRARLRGVTVESVDRLVVFERDDWTCKLCNKPLDRNATSPWAPMRPSLDHVVPLSLGGAHTYENVQAAHLRCNLKKGNRLAVAA